VGVLEPLDLVALACRVLYANQPAAWIFAALFRRRGGATTSGRAS
jgi:hypothetical protein